MASRTLQTAALVLMAALASLPGARPCRADFGNADSPWSVSAYLGGTLVVGRVEHSYDGRRLDTQDRDWLRVTLDARGTVTRAFGRWFALGAQLGASNWHSEYRRDAGGHRSTYLSLALSPELRLPLGSCVLCPLAYVAPRVGVAASQLGLGSTHAAVKERGWAGWGGVVGGRIGLRLRLHRRLAFGLRLESGVEKAWLRHRVELVGLGHERQDFVIVRPVNLIGFWWNL